MWSDKERIQFPPAVHFRESGVELQVDAFEDVVGMERGQESFHPGDGARRVFEG